MEMKAIRLDYICAAEFKWKAGGTPAPPGSGSERKRTPPPTTHSNLHQQQFSLPHLICTTGAEALNLRHCRRRC